MRSSTLSALLTALSAPVASTALGVEPGAARVAVDFAPAKAADNWFASALEALVGEELSRFRRVVVVDRVDASSCAERESRCLVEAYRRSGVDVVVLGALADTRLDYVVYETWTGTRAFQGSLSLRRGTSSASLQQHVGNIIRPIVQGGGLLDKKPSEVSVPLASAGVAVNSTSAPSSTGRAGALRLLIAAIGIFLATPILLVWFLLGRAELSKQSKPLSWIWIAVLEVVLAIVLVGSTLPDSGPLLDRLLAARLWIRIRPFLEMVAPIAGGMLWGGLALVTAGWAIPVMHGLSRIRHDALWPLLRAWVLAVCLRLCLLVVLYGPPMVFALFACRALAIEPLVAILFVVPAAGLLGHFWLLSVVDNLSLYLDRKWVDGSATRRNPWHATMRRYFFGYVRRNGVDLDRDLLERVLFLPGSGSEVISYGGGLSPARILVGAVPREIALGELPDEREVPERTMYPEELPYGLLLPEGTARSKKDWRLRAMAGLQERRARGLEPAIIRSSTGRLIGENATRIGWVMPAPRDVSVPLIANTREDYEAVRQLLTEHYALFEKNLDEEEYDDTDPTQKDFLFGGLLREVGTILRRDCRLSTIALALRRGSSPVSSRLPAPVADAFAGLNTGLDHLIQYLHLSNGGNPDLLTARANAPRLQRTSKEILDIASQEAPKGQKTHWLRIDPRDRLMRLSRLFYAPLAKPRDFRLRVLAVFLALITAGIVLARAARAAIGYHPVYVERLREMQDRAAHEQGGPNGGQEH
jgi:hypothetical protein